MENVSSFALLEYSFPLNLFFDIANSFVISLLVFCICKVYKINHNLTFVLFLSCFTPFLFNGFIFDWTVFPDQSKYIRQSSELRGLDFPLEEFKLSIHRLTISKYLYSIIPVPFIEGFKSIGFANRFILILLIIFLVKKRFDENFILILLLLPSIILYSSVSLRDNLIIILSILFFYNFFEKNYLFFFIVGFLLYFSKFQNLVFYIFILINYIIFFKINFKNKDQIIKVIYVFTILVLFIIFNNELIDILNHKRYGLYDEEFGSKQGFSKISLTNFLELTVLGLINFFITPIKSIGSIFGLILVIDTIIMYAITYYFLKKVYIKNKFLSIYWTLALIFISSMYSLVTFNDGTIHRYKLVFFIPILFAAIKSTGQKNV